MVFGSNAGLNLITWNLSPVNGTNTTDGVTFSGFSSDPDADVAGTGNAQ